MSDNGIFLRHSFLVFYFTCMTLAPIYVQSTSCIECKWLVASARRVVQSYTKPECGTFINLNGEQRNTQILFASTRSLHSTFTPKQSIKLYFDNCFSQN